MSPAAAASSVPAPSAAPTNVATAATSVAHSATSKPPGSLVPVTLPGPMDFARMAAGHRVPQCDGTDISAWLYSFEAYCALLALPEDQFLTEVATFLTGDARIWHAATSVSTWSEWKEAAVARFEDEEEDPSYRLKSIFLTDFMSIREFVNAFQAVAVKLLQIHVNGTEGEERARTVARFHVNTALPILEDAVTPPYANLLRKRKPATLDAAYAVIREQYNIHVKRQKDEDARATSKWNPFVTVTKSTRDTATIAALEAKLEEMTRRVESMFMSHEQNPRPRRNYTVTCYNCEEVGHVSRDCQANCSICQEAHPNYYCPHRRRPNSGGGGRPQDILLAEQEFANKRALSASASPQGLNKRTSSAYVFDQSHVDLAAQPFSHTLEVVEYHSPPELQPLHEMPPMEIPSRPPTPSGAKGHRRASAPSPDHDITPPPMPREEREAGLSPSPTRIEHAKKAEREQAEKKSPEVPMGVHHSRWNPDAEKSQDTADIAPASPVRGMLNSQWNPTHPDTFVFEEEIIEEFDEPIRNDKYNDVSVETAPPSPARCHSPEPRLSTQEVYPEPPQEDLSGPNKRQRTKNPQATDVAEVEINNSDQYNLSMGRSNQRYPVYPQKATQQTSSEVKIGNWTNSPMDTSSPQGGSAMDTRNTPEERTHISELITQHDNRFGTNLAERLAQVKGTAPGLKGTIRELPSTLTMGLSATDLLANTSLTISWADLCRESPQFRQKLHNAVSALIPRRKENAFLAGTGAPRTTGFVNMQATAIILDGGAFSNIVSSPFLKRLGKFRLRPSNTCFVMADGSMSSCVGIVDNLPLQIGGVHTLISAAVFNHNQYNMLLGRQTMSKLQITTHFADNRWTIAHNSSVVDLQVSFDDSRATHTSFLCEILDNKIRANPNLEVDQKDALLEVLKPFARHVVSDTEDLPEARGFVHEIDTGNARPVASRPYRLAHYKEKFAREETQRLLDQGLIRPSRSPWSSPLVVVPKKMANSGCASTSFR